VYLPPVDGYSQKVQRFVQKSKKSVLLQSSLSLSFLTYWGHWILETPILMLSCETCCLLLTRNIVHGPDHWNLIGLAWSSAADLFRVGSQIAIIRDTPSSTIAGNKPFKNKFDENQMWKCVFLGILLGTFSKN